LYSYFRKIFYCQCKFSVKDERLPPTYPVTGALQYSALAIYGDGSARDVTATSGWTSANVPAGGAVVATVGLNTGIATGKSIGQSAITAAYGIKTATATLTVTAPNPGAAGSAPASLLLPAHMGSVMPREP
jgi:hypothetical protein